MEGATNSELLWAKIRLAEERLFSATSTFWTHPRLPQLLAPFLMQAHCVMRSSLTLMSVAQDRALALPDDPVARGLASYLRVHLEEELGHDLWMLEDIKALGFTEREVFCAQPCTALVSMIGAQYFWMTHVHPVAIMGYLILAEGYAPLASQLDEIQARTGAPADAFRCLRRHADDDPSHLAGLNKTLDSMCLGVSQARAVGLCAFAAIEGLAAMFEELLQAGIPGPKEFEHAHA